MDLNAKLEEMYNYCTLRESIMFRAMDNEGLTYGETIAMLFLTRGDEVTNNNPGVFKGFIPIKD